MNQNIVAYLQENKEKYPQEMLVDQLKKAGYLELDIQEGILIVFNNAKSSLTQKEVALMNFWDFKTPKIYTGSYEKWKDFLFGFFVPFLMWIFVVLIPLLSLVVHLMLYIFALVYLSNRRKFIFYGLLSRLLLEVPVIFMIVIKGLIF
jgi:hypothetical protein